MSAFERLTPAFQYQVINTLGFRELRPVQLMTIETVLDGKNCVVLAPTAGGKTEAAFFPLLSAMDAGEWKPVSVLYLSPIRALLNNQEDRVARYAGTVGRRVFKWHGDTGPSARKAFLREPADILLSTPESLEAMLMSARVPEAQIFAGLRAVIIDEVHAFAADDRGAHLASVLERLTRFCGNDVQRIGLSATVGNPEEILRWLQGRSKREAAVVSPPRSKTSPDVKLDYVATLENSALAVRQLHPGKKRLVFVDSRKGVEDLGNLLRRDAVNTFLIHGSLAASERRDSERAFRDESDCVIVSTSALELGIDIGDLDYVLQINSPSSVASFLQRMGRTGRRAGTNSNCTFLAVKDDAVLQAAAILQLHQDGFVESVRPSRRAFHIMAHQILALSIQRDGIGRTDWAAWVEGATPFADITADERAAIVAHMIEKEILLDTQGKLSLGPVGEKLYGRRNFAELYAVFSTPRFISVLWDKQDVGTVDAEFLSTLDSDTQRSAFSLAGRPWEIVRTDWSKGVCTVKPADFAPSARWSGSPAFLSYELCQAMRRVLVSDEVSPAWSARASKVMRASRVEYSFLRDEPAPMITEKDKVTWWTFAGGRANVLLSKLIEAELGGKCVVNDKSITCKDEAGESIVRLRDFARELGARGGPTREDALRFAGNSAGRARLSKFRPCLPEALLDEYVADRALDVAGAAEATSRAGG